MVVQPDKCHYTLVLKYSASQVEKENLPMQHPVQFTANYLWLPFWTRNVPSIFMQILYQSTEWNINSWGNKPVSSYLRGIVIDVLDLCGSKEKQISEFPDYDVLP